MWCATNDVMISNWFNLFCFCFNAEQVLNRWSRLIRRQKKKTQPKEHDVDEEEQLENPRFVMGTYCLAEPTQLFSLLKRTVNELKPKQKQTKRMISHRRRRRRRRREKKPWLYEWIAWQNVFDCYSSIRPRSRSAVHKHTPHPFQMNLRIRDCIINEQPRNNQTNEINSSCGQ